MNISCSTSLEGSLVERAPLASLRGVSAEVKCMILHYLDFESLKALVRTSRSFRQVYLDSRTSILAAIVVDAIQPDNLRDALAVFWASQLENHNDSDLSSILEEYKAQDETLLKLSSFPHGRLMQIITFHKKYVEFFSDEFVKATLALHPITMEPDPTPRPASPIEVLRIQRAFYRIHLLSYLGGRSRSSIEQLKLRRSDKKDNARWRFLRRYHVVNTDALTVHYTEWEFEEIACVVDYLHNRLLEPCVDMMRLFCRKNNTAWSEGFSGRFRTTMFRSTRQGKSGKEAHMHHYILSGLIFLREVITTQDLDRRRLLLRAHKRCNRFLEIVFDVDHLERIVSGQRDNSYQGVKCDTSNKPNGAWVWICQSRRGVSMNCYERQYSHLREWGYCMWDIPRLNAWGVLEKEHDPSEHREWYRVLGEDHQRRYKEALLHEIDVEARWQSESCDVMADEAERRWTPARIFGRDGYNLPDWGDDGDNLSNWDEDGNSLPDSDEDGNSLPDSDEDGNSLPDSDEDGNSLPDSDEHCDSLPDSDGSVDWWDIGSLDTGYDHPFSHTSWSFIRSQLVGNIGLTEVETP